MTRFAFRVAICAAIFYALATHQTHAVTIPTVPIGNPGNEADTRYDATGFGSVGYNYRIGKDEVTAGQYTEFLVAVADTDAYGLYSPHMGEPVNNLGANIQRSGSSGTYSYSVAPDWANRPVNHVNLWDAMRFANWLHNGQPTTGVQDATTTEDGAYDLDGYTGFDGTWIVRKPGARYFIPTEDEWYKAAYHKNDGATGNYWEYRTKSDIAPNNTLPDPGNHANFDAGDGTGNGP